MDKIRDLSDKDGRYIFRENPRPSGYSSEYFGDNEKFETDDELNKYITKRTAERNARETVRYGYDRSRKGRSM